MAKDGLILVFDMDQTIIDSDPFFKSNPLDYSRIPEYLNMNVVNILLRAAKLRPKKVTAIFLLTNNSDKQFVAAVDSALYELSMGSRGKYNTVESMDTNSSKMPHKAYFFDDIFMLDHPKRKPTSQGIPPGIKDLHTVLEMMHTINSDEHPNIIKNLFFFDDIPNHKLHDEFLNFSSGKYKNHYITISPPYQKGKIDKTNYKPVLKALQKLDKKPATLSLRKTRRNH
jgi:hypothetical protein